MQATTRTQFASSPVIGQWVADCAERFWGNNNSAKSIVAGNRLFIKIPNQNSFLNVQQRGLYEKIRTFWKYSSIHKFVSDPFFIANRIYYRFIAKNRCKGRHG
jgi:hypothetical protein